MALYTYVRRSTGLAAASLVRAAPRSVLGQRLGNRAMLQLVRTAENPDRAAERRDDKLKEAAILPEGLTTTRAAKSRAAIAPPPDTLARQEQPLREPGVGTEREECTPDPGLAPSTCSAYLANAWWLPLAYVNNATCACQETPNVPTANCVRKFLQDRLAATSGWVKAMAAGQKFNDIPGSPTYPAYQAFVQAFLTPRIYADHVDAFSNCCCPSGPAPYPAWIGVTSTPMPCPAVGWSIRQFGSCHGTPGSW